MKRTVLGTGVILFAACGAFGQQAATPSFDVASIKPAPPPTAGFLRVMMSGGPGDPRDPGRVNWENVSLKDILRTAYGLRDYQITGPDWLNSARFNIVATVPPGTNKDQYALMWQNLLKERFGLSAHRETKDLPAYALAVAKGGSKMAVAADDPPTTGDDGPGGPGVGPGGGPVGRGPVGGAAAGYGGPGGPRGPMRNGMMMMRGMGHLEAKGVPVSTFVDMLSRQLDRPVEDQTGLTAKYDFKLDYTPDESTPGMGAKMGMPMPMMRAEGGGDGHADHAADNNSPSIFTAVQTQLGLKLEAKKLPIEMLIIDHVEKTSTEN